MVSISLHGDMSSGEGYNVLLAIRTERQMDVFLETDEFAQVGGDQESHPGPRSHM